MTFDFAGFHEKIQKSLDHFKSDLGSLRTGRASAQILEPVNVEAYGTHMKITELASISAPDANMLVISPWDKSLLGAIEKAIASAGINLNPVVDGDIIRIVIAALTQEKRQEYVKLLHQKMEAGRVMLRSIRSDTKQEIEDRQGEAGISEDDVERDLSELDKLIAQAIEKLEQIGAAKEKELLTL